MINKHLSDMSCDEEEFQKAKSLYENALNESGCKWEMKYHKIERLQTTRTNSISKMV